MCRVGVFAFLAAMFLLVKSGVSEEIFPADVIVVLGNAVYKNGTPSTRLAARLDQARILYENGMGKTIIVSGGTSRHGVDEATVMRNYLIQKGIPQGSIVMDPNGVNTFETARFTAKYLRAGGGKSALAVTQYFHVPRTAMAFGRFGVPFVGKSYARFVEWRDVYSLAREVLGYGYYLVRPV